MLHSSTKSIIRIMYLVPRTSITLMQSSHYSRAEFGTFFQALEVIFVSVATTVHKLFARIHFRIVTVSLDHRSAWATIHWQ